MTRISFHRIAIAALLILSTSVSAGAQSPQSEYTRRNAAAEAAYVRGDYEAALRLSLQALAVAVPGNGAADQVFEQYARAGGAAEMLGRYDEAADYFRKFIDAIRAALGDDDKINIAFGQEMLARVLCKLGQLDEAERLIEAVSEARAAMPFGADAFRSVELSNRATLELARGRLDEALALHRKLVAEIVQNGAIPTRDAAIVNTDPTNSATFTGLARVAWEIGQRHPEQAASLRDEAFLAAQWKWRTSASAALASAARRGEGAEAQQTRDVQDIATQIRQLESEQEANLQSWFAERTEDPLYAELETNYMAALPSNEEAMRGMQDLLTESQKTLDMQQNYEKLMSDCGGYTPACMERYGDMQQEIESRLLGKSPSRVDTGSLLARHAEADAALKAREHQLPGYAEYERRRVEFEIKLGEMRGKLAAASHRHERPTSAGTPSVVKESDPLPVAAVQALLSPSEALLFFLSGKDESYLWVVTHDDIRWSRLALSVPALQREVTALRCGLDAEAWFDPDTRCPGLSGAIYSAEDSDAGRPLPFDRARAFALYQTLFGEMRDAIAGKSLLVVPTGALAQLPLQVLVTQQSGADTDQPGWLIREHAVSVLPSVTALQTLRDGAAPAHAAKPMAGFGNPLLNGPDERFAPWAAAARDKQECQASAPSQIAGATRSLQRVTKELASVDEIRSQSPLPETADELCAVAAALGAPREDVFLGARATETQIKTLSAEGALAQYRVVHFATHGTLAGQVSGSRQPGLLLTPPEKAGTRDDGYLSAPEIAALRLAADWVILSACNSAGGGADSDEELSGLAQAFFYAGSRAVVVSHWAVDSNATVKLVTHALAAMAADESAGGAESLRRAMLALIDGGTPHEAEPAYWAPFVVVGEGSIR